MSFTVLILIASCSWRKFRTDENFIAEVDQENDPFLSGNYTTGEKKRQKPTKPNYSRIVVMGPDKTPVRTQKIFILRTCVQLS